MNRGSFTANPQAIMKQCPACKTTYTDDSLSFCLADGNPLIDLNAEEQTVVRSGKDPLRVDLSQGPDLPVVPKAESRSSGSSTWIKIVIAVIVLAVAGLGALGLAGVAYYYGSAGATPEPAPRTPSPSPTVVAPTPDVEKEKMRDEIANIRKRLQDRNTNESKRPESETDRPVKVATANSPGDGFLALRSEPSSETGSRITKIPHGARIEIVRCGNYVTTARNNYGRWCYARYSGYSGWVFDAFVRY